MPRSNDGMVSLRAGGVQGVPAALDVDEMIRGGRNDPDTYVVLAESYVDLGRHTEAKDIAQTELDLARAWGAARAIGIAARVLGRIREDIDLLQESVTVLAESEIDVEHALSLQELGMAWLSREDQANARLCLHQAFRLATDCGAAYRILGIISREALKAMTSAA